MKKIIAIAGLILLIMGFNSAGAQDGQFPMPPKHFVDYGWHEVSFGSMHVYTYENCNETGANGLTCREVYADVYANGIEYRQYVADTLPYWVNIHGFWDGNQINHTIGSIIYGFSGGCTADNKCGVRWHNDNSFCNWQRASWPGGECISYAGYSPRPYNVSHSDHYDGTFYAITSL